MTFEDYVEQSETHIRMLDDRIENLYNEGRDDEANKLTEQWKTEVNQLDAFIAKTRKLSSPIMKKKINW